MIIEQLYVNDGHFPPSGGVSGSHAVATRSTGQMHRELGMRH